MSVTTTLSVDILRRVPSPYHAEGPQANFRGSLHKNTLQRLHSEGAIRLTGKIHKSPIWFTGAHAPSLWEPYTLPALNTLFNLQRCTQHTVYNHFVKRLY